MSQGGRSNLINFDDNGLASAVDDSTTTIQVLSATDLPAVPFYFVIDPFNFENYEVLYCTEVNTTTLTVVRNLEGTKGLTHTQQINGAPNIVRFAYSQQQLDDLWDAVEGIASNLTVAPYIFDAATTNTPAAGHWGRDNVDPTLATELYFEKTDEFGRSNTVAFEEMKSGDVIYISSRTQEGDLERHVITDVPTLTLTVYTVPVKDGELQGVAFTDQTLTKMALLWGRELALDDLVDVEVTGAEDLQVLGFQLSTGTWIPITNTANKGITSLDYLYDANQDVNPPSGDVSPDNATPASVTNLAISNIDVNGNDITFVLANIKAGDLLVIQQKADGTNREDYDVVSNTDQGTFRDIGVTPTGDNGTINDNDPVFVHTLSQLPDLDAVYLRLDTTNDPLTGPLSLGNNQLNLIADGAIATDGVSKGQSEAYTDAVAVAEAIKRMQWLNVWAPGTYEEFDTVYDQGWTMVANTQTSDRAAPQPSGGPVTSLPDLPAWAQQQFAGFVLYSNVYTFATLGSLTGFRIWIQDVDPGVEYTPFLQDRTDPANVVTTILDPVLGSSFPPGWLEVNLQGTLVLPGTIFAVGVILNDTSSFTTFNGNWDFAGSNNVENDPGIGASEYNLAGTLLRVNKTDNDLNDRTVDLGDVVAGSQILFGGTTNTVQLVVDNGTYFTYTVSRVGAEPVQAVYDHVFNNPDAPDVDYVEIVAQWSTTPTWASNIDGELSLDGAPAVVSDNAYGTDLRIQVYTSSTEWDLLSIAAAGGSGGGGGPAPNGLPVGGTAGQHLTKVDAEDFNSQWDDQLHADLIDVSADQHHPQVHIHDGVDGSGTVTHANTTGQTPNDHHAQVHAIDGADHTGTLDALYVRLDGSTMTGLLVLSADPVVDLGAATKVYVDDTVGGTAPFLELAGGTMVGDILMSGAAHVDLGGTELLGFVDLKDIYTGALRMSVSGGGSGTTAIHGPSGTTQFSVGDNQVSVFQLLNMDNHLISLVLDPVSNQDAANKRYVDERDALYLPLAGGIMSGFLTLNADPTDALHAATMQYVDAGDTGGYQDPLTTTGDLLRFDAATERYAIGTEDQVLTVVSGLPTWQTAVTGITDHAFLTNVTTSQHHVRYDDGEAVSANTGIWLSIGGGTLTGLLTLSGAPTVDLHAATKLYVDGQDHDHATPIAAHAGDASAHHVQTPAQTFLHNDLSDVSTSQHHVRYSDAEAVAAVHTRYTDGEAISANTGLWLPIGGGTLTGFLTLNADPTANLHAATMQYVDANHIISNSEPGSPRIGDIWVDPDFTNVGVFLPLAGGTMTGALVLNADPSANLGAATKQYVDNLDTGSPSGRFIAITRGLELSNQTVSSASWIDFGTSMNMGGTSGSNAWITAQCIASTLASSTGASVYRMRVGISDDGGSTYVYGNQPWGSSEPTPRRQTMSASVVRDLGDIGGNSVRVKAQIFLSSGVATSFEQGTLTAVMAKTDGLT